MGRKISRGPAMAVVAIAYLLLCSATARPQQTVTARHAKEFLRLARAELTSGNECIEAIRYARELPLKQRLALARAVVNDQDARIGYVGASILIEHGHARDAAPALAEIIASGRLETQLNGRIGYDWVHSDDETRFLRMAILINRYLLTNLEKYEGQARTRVEEVLMGGLFDTPTMPFSRKEAERRISGWEASLAKTRRR